MTLTFFVHILNIFTVEKLSFPNQLIKQSFVIPHREIDEQVKALVYSIVERNTCEVRKNF